MKIAPPCTPKKSDKNSTEKLHQITPSIPPKSGISDDVGDIPNSAKEDIRAEELSGSDDAISSESSGSYKRTEHPCEQFNQRGWWRRYNRLEFKFTAMTKKMEELKVNLNNETKFVRELTRDYDKLKKIKKYGMKN